jgi:hypothetical protein
MTESLATLYNSNHYLKPRSSHCSNRVGRLPLRPFFGSMGVAPDHCEPDRIYV